MLKKIYEELVLIRKELQAIQSSMESLIEVKDDKNDTVGKAKELLGFRK